MPAHAHRTAPPVPAGGRPELADVFRQFGPTYLRTHVLAPEQARVLRHVIDCRTPALGGHVDTCDHCNQRFVAYNSCRDRHCPVCQGAQQLAWINRRMRRMLATHHFHVVFTMPSELRALALANRRVLYDLLFAAATDTLLELARTHWDAEPGITAVLHTWSRQMALHPHVHCIVTGGGLADDDGWFSCDQEYLFPLGVLRALFRGKFMDGLVAAYRAQELQFVGTSAHLADPNEFAALRRLLYELDWVVHPKKTFGNPERVVRYLGRYTHRVAISNSRLLSVSATEIVFTTRDGGTCALHPDEFIRRFLLHVLPKGFRKIRHYGLLAPSNVATKLATARRIVDGLRRQVRERTRSASPAPHAIVVPDRTCPSCQLGQLRRMTIPPARAPPVPP